MNFELGFLKSKVARRVVILFFISALIPILITAILSITYVTNLLYEDSHTQLRRAGKFYGMSVLDRLKSAEVKLQNAVVNINSGQVDLENVGREFSAELNSLALIMPNGKIKMLLGDNDGYPIKRTITDIENEDVTNKPKIFTQMLDQPSRRVYMQFNLDTSRTNYMRLVAELKQNYLWGDKDILPFSENLCVLEGNLIVLFCSYPVPESIFTQTISDSSASSTKQFSWRDADEKYLAARWELFLKSRYNTANWTIVTSQRESEALLPVTTFIKLFPLIIIMSLLIVALLSISQIRRSLVPLERLLDGTRRVANREFSSQVKINSNDEFEELANSFNAMTTRLGKQFKALTILSEIDKIILFNPNIESVLNACLKRIRDITSCDCISISIFDRYSPGAGRTYFNDNDSQYASEIKTTILTPEISGMLLDNPIIMELDISADSRDFFGSLKERTINFLYIFPIIINGNVFAVLSVGFQNQIVLSYDDKEHLRELADRLAVAMATAERDEKLYRQAHYDTLTNLPNRQLLSDRIAQEISHAHRESHLVALIFIDLDHFKKVNDTLGHTVGDMLLQQTADRLKRCVREADTVARLGGDEFTMVLSRLSSPKDASVVADNAIKIISEPFVIEQHEIFVSASAGISIYPNDGENSEELLKNADTAMYRAKEKGRGRLQFFEEQMNIEDIERTNIERDLRHAVERNEFVLYYQPIVLLDRNKVMGVEALIRWNHATRGLILPSLFIPIAEDTGLIEKVGEWVLQNACKQFQSWQGQGVDIKRISVNVSSRQFMQTDFVGMVSKILAEYKMPTHCLELEITESLLLDDRVDIVEILNKLHDMGVLLSIDDFGTGYSSLSYLKRLPVDTLKIDRSFMHDVPDDEDATSIANSIIVLAHTLRKKVIAEGVETNEQVRLLRNLGCDMAQGSFFNLPMGADQISDYLRNDIKPLEID